MRALYSLSMCRQEITECTAKSGDAAQAEPARTQEAEEVVGEGERRGEERQEEEEGEEVMKYESELKLGPPGPPFGIVINGHSLVSGAVFSPGRFGVLERYPLTREGVSADRFVGLNRCACVCAYAY